MFSKDYFNLQQSKNELQKMGFPNSGYRVTKNFYRFRIADPNPNMQKKTIIMSKGIEAIYEY
jgi:hypothetical protein